MLDPAFSRGLPPFLARDPGTNSGYMLAQYTAASLVSENKVLAHPASVDTIPTSGNQEDHVSMGWTSVRKLREVVAQRARGALRSRSCAAAQAIDLRAEVAAPGAGERRRARGWCARRCRRWTPTATSSVQIAAVDGLLPEIVGAAEAAIGALA